MTNRLKKIMPKQFLESKTFWSGIGTIGAGLSMIFTSPQLTTGVLTTAAFTVITGATSIYGRAVAQGPLTLADPPAATAPKTGGATH
jgi:hypothetical protein